MESSFLVAFFIYIFVGIWSLFVNKPTLGKVIGKFFYLAGMLVVAFIPVILTADSSSSSEQMIGSLISCVILGFSLWGSFKW